MTPRLAALIGRARRHTPTPAEVASQRISFARGCRPWDCTPAAFLGAIPGPGDPEKPPENPKNG